jgi:hypothetical protein
MADPWGRCGRPPALLAGDGARSLDGKQFTEFWARVGNSTRQLVGTDIAQYQREHWG